ncbi:HAD-IIB family hydrolase [Terrihabitans sp. B22-R8]|uniref:HAD-IIB family hydrolase n=1 Tax=Terrihabitans sp. B22-R8 TaxID=3425128 RepID=UPI00403C24EC
MYLLAFATDYDGTLAEHGVVDDSTIAALERLKASGRRLLMVTGRELPDLKRVFERLDVFDVIVAENGSLLYFPETKEERLVAACPPPALVDALRGRGVEPLSVGQGIIATWEPNETAVLECIRDLGLDWQIIFNKGAVMVLPPGINKASGLLAALDTLDLSPLNVLAIGDAENDHAFMLASGCGVAVANALDSVKETSDAVMKGERGAGVVEAIDLLIEDENHFMDRAEPRRRITLDPDATAILRPNHGGVLIAGSSGIGKSTLATAIVEKLSAQGFQTCVLDPEGDYDHLEGAVVLGDARHPPVASEVIDVLRKPTEKALAVNMLGLRLEDRPNFFISLLLQICELRAQTARPHWMIIDEAHHMLPSESEMPTASFPQNLSAAIYVTVHPDMMSAKVLSGVNTIIGVGPKAGDVIASFCQIVNIPVPPLPEGGDREQVLYWDRTNDDPPRRIEVDKPKQAHQRHTRKYAEGELGEESSFFFRGPDGKLNLRVHNLMIFLQIADGVDDATWLHHLKQGDYANWFRDGIKDDDLAEEAEGVHGDDAQETRRQIREIVERRYTAPAQAKDGR